MPSLGIVSILTGEVNLQYLQVFMKIPVGIGLSIDTILAGEDTLSLLVMARLKPKIWYSILIIRRRTRSSLFDE